MSPSSPVHGGQHDTKYLVPGMWQSSCYCMRNSWLTKSGVSYLNQLVHISFFFVTIKRVVTPTGFFLSLGAFHRRFFFFLVTRGVTPTICYVTPGVTTTNASFLSFGASRRHVFVALGRFHRHFFFFVSRGDQPTIMGIFWALNLRRQQIRIIYLLWDSK